MLIEKVPDVANLILASMVLGQFLTDEPYSVALALVGLGAWATLTAVALRLAKND